jgi:hypothetical protein
VEGRLAALAVDARSAREALEAAASAWARPSVAAVLAAPDALRAVVVRRILRDLRGDLRGLTRAHVEAVVTLVVEGPSRGEVHLAGGALVRRDDALFWDPARGKRARFRGPAS